MRHRWSAPTLYATDRQCERCGMIRRTHHDSEWPWVSWWNGDDQVEAKRTPACEPVKEEHIHAMA